MSEQIGKHKGAVETLLHEKKELSRILQIVNSQLQRHLSALEEAGVDTDEFIQSVQEETQQGEKQSRKRKQREQSNSEGRQERSSKQREKRDRSQESNDSEEETDTDELLEGDNDVGSRDFNPNR